MPQLIQCPSITIIIPVHNAEKTLRGCVESIVCQKYPNLQLILVENNSSDTSGALCMELKRAFDNIEVVQTKRMGVSMARNIGLKLAKGDIIGFCDADDIYLDNCLETVIKLFAENPACDAVVTGICNVRPDGTRKMSSVGKKTIWSFRTLSRHVLYDSRVMGSTWNKFFKRELLSGIAFDETLSLCEDTHYLMKVLSQHAKCNAVITDACTYEYRASPESATNRVSYLFDTEGKLKYENAMNAILEDCTLPLSTKWLVYRSKYKIAYQSTIRFDLNEKQKMVIKKILKENFVYFLLTFYVEPVKTGKLLLKQCLKALK